MSGSDVKHESHTPAGLRPSGFDPSRVTRVAGWLSASGKRNLLALPSTGWMTVAEMKPRATGSGMDLLEVRYRLHDRLCERRWTRWGSEPGQKRGEGYEYSITPFGEAVRQFLRDSDGSGEADKTGTGLAEGNSAGR